MTDQIQIRVSTSALRRLLEETPDLLLKVESMACEKIAEELNREIDKFQHTRKASVVSELEKEIKAKINYDLSSKYRLPNEVMATIREVVGTVAKETLKKERDTALREITEEARKKIGPLVTEAQTQLYNELNKEYDRQRREQQNAIRQMAREEFLSVLREAKANLT